MPGIVFNCCILGPADFLRFTCWLKCHGCDFELVIAKRAGIQPRIRTVPESDGIWDIWYRGNLVRGHNGSVRGPSDVANLMIGEGKAPDDL